MGHGELSLQFLVRLLMAFVGRKNLTESSRYSDKNDSNQSNTLEIRDLLVRIQNFASGDFVKFVRGPLVVAEAVGDGMVAVVSVNAPPSLVMFVVVIESCVVVIGLADVISSVVPFTLLSVDVPVCSVSTDVIGSVSVDVVKVPLELCVVELMPFGVIGSSVVLLVPDDSVVALSL